MGFCRRCGDIVIGERCKCGGTAVAASTRFTKPFASQPSQDKWSSTYVSREKDPETTNSVLPPVKANNTGGAASNTPSDPSLSPSKRFPRPLSSYSSPSPKSTLTSISPTSASSVQQRVTAHITSTTSRINRPPSPLKHSSTPVPEADILPSLYGSSLTKVYGSVLQTQESLSTYSCAICDTQFQPDATIYPDPNDPDSNDRFLCLSCFSSNGGSKGICPTCARPVLAIKSQGGFVRASGQVWHKQCFNCSGCHKNIGDTPVVNLLGQPSCVDCFDGCLKSTTPKKRNSESVQSSPSLGTMGLSIKTSGDSSRRESGPVMEELEQRLGIKSREASPSLEELDRRLSSFTAKDPLTPTRPSTSSRYSTFKSPDQSPVISSSRRRHDSSSSSTRPDMMKQQHTGNTARYSLGGSPSPIRRTLTGGSVATEDAIEEMKRRFMRESTGTPREVQDIPSTPSSRRMRRPRSSASMHSSFSPQITDTRPFSECGSPVPSTPDLLSDMSDSATQSSLPASPPRNDMERSDPVRTSLHGQFYADETRGGDYQDYRPSRPRTSSTPVKSPTPVRSPPSVKSPSPRTREDLRPRTSSKGPALTPPKTASPSTCCAKCGGGLFTVANGSGSMDARFVTVPDDDNQQDGATKSKMYHRECFRCVVCDGLFREGSKGQAIFVRAAGGPCHTECAPPERVVLKSTPNSNVVPSIFSRKAASTPTVKQVDLPPTKQTRPPPSAPASMSTFPRFGSTSNCPGCHKSVSPMERGVVPGPQGTRWHVSCLVCGGKKPPQGLFAPKRNKDEPGCGKKLDSAAKGDMEGGVWCRECSLLLPLTMRDSPQSSPTRTNPVLPTHTGGSSARGAIPTHYTGGTTTIARQWTGMGSGDTALNRQMTGGGLNPTRQLSSSPTKQLGSAPRPLGRPRPKSVVGFRMDERGKVGGLLSKQTTGSSASSGGWRY